MDTEAANKAELSSKKGFFDFAKKMMEAIASRMALRHEVRAVPRNVYWGIIPLPEPHAQWIHTRFVTPKLAKRYPGVTEGDRIVERRVPITHCIARVDNSRYDGEKIRRLNAEHGISGRRWKARQEQLA
jgi:hypothetical protein